MSNIVLGVSAGIAAYRACDLIGRLRERGANVRVAMTPSATRFVTELTFASLSGHRVLVDELAAAPAEAEIAHIAWARWADAVVVAPATADLIARVAHGFANDALTCLLLALDADKPVLFAPAMNAAMWSNPLVQRNVALLRDVGVGRRFRFLEPVAKRLACGEEGVGGLPSSEVIADWVAGQLATR